MELDAADFKFFEDPLLELLLEVSFQERMIPSSH